MNNRNIEIRKKIFYIAAAFAVIISFYLSFITLGSIGLFVMFTPTFIFLTWVFIVVDPFFSKPSKTPVNQGIKIFLVLCISVLLGLLLVYFETV